MVDVFFCHITQNDLESTYFDTITKIKESINFMLLKRKIKYAEVIRVL